MRVVKGTSSLRAMILRLQPRVLRYLTPFEGKRRVQARSDLILDDDCWIYRYSGLEH
jgi:hypothetical protein